MLTSTLLLSSVALMASLSSAAPYGAPDKRQSSVSVVSTCRTSGEVAVTFDDGPFQYEVDITQRLNGGKGTFFFNGNNYGCIYDQADTLKQLNANSHTLGNHGWSHKDFTTLTRDQMHDELWRVEEAFIKILGLRPLYFRPPYGNYNDQVLAVLAERGYKKVVLWDADTEDASGASVSSSIGTYDPIVASFPEPHIVLNHSPLDTTAYQVIPAVVPRLQGAGYQLVSVDTCLGSDGEWPYAYVGRPQQRDGSWHC